MRLRAATPDDLPLILRWDEAPHIAQSGGDPEWNDWDWQNQLGRTVPWREFLIAEAEGRPVGFIQIIDPKEEESHYWGACDANLRAIDIWIGDPADTGRGLGAEMMRRAIARCFADPKVAAILIDPLAANTRAHRFYEKCGFRFVEARSFGPDACLVYRLNRADWRSESSQGN